jgi:hypothetical protein
MKPRNLIAKDLFTPKYRMRVVKNKKKINRQKDKILLRKELYATRKIFSGL